MFDTEIECDLYNYSDNNSGSGDIRTKWHIRRRQVPFTQDGLQ